MNEAQLHRVAPRNTVTDILSRLWCDILQVGQVGKQDDFFVLGGDSLGAAQLFVEIEKQFGKRLPVATLLDGATIEYLARLLEGESAAAQESCLVNLQPEGSNPPFFLIHGV